MAGPTIPNQTYTPEQAADLLQLSKNTIYELIGRGAIPAKRFGKVYRIPSASLAFVFTGLDLDLFQSEQADVVNLERVHAALTEVRAGN